MVASHFTVMTTLQHPSTEAQDWPSGYNTTCFTGILGLFLPTCLGCDCLLVSLQCPGRTLEVLWEFVQWRRWPTLLTSCHFVLLEDHYLDFQYTLYRLTVGSVTVRAVPLLEVCSAVRCHWFPSCC